MSDILTQEAIDGLAAHLDNDAPFEDWSDGLESLMNSHAELRACIQQAVLDVEKMPHKDDCASKKGRKQCMLCADEEVKGISTGFCRECPRADCNCGHDAAIDGLKKGLGKKL